MEDNNPIEIRKIVPVVARVSAGKSTLLNTIFNIDFLECKAGIGTKFINILRYNPNIKEPRFFHLIVKKEGNEYKFYKDNLYHEVIGHQKILEENKKINQYLNKEKNIIFEKNFYMTEINESPFIKDEKYLLSHDLCDIPGLSEANEDDPNKLDEEKQDNKEGKDLKSVNINSKFKLSEKNSDDKNNNNQKENRIIEEKDEENQIKNLMKNIQNDLIIKDKKEEDDLFYNTEVEKTSYIYEIFNIIKNYIEGGIIILDRNNYHYKENFELIALLHKIIEKKIIDFLIVLNKIDTSDSNPKKDIEKCKAYFFKYFPSCKTFNLNLNTFIPLSAEQLRNALLSPTSFRYLLRYHLKNYIAKMKQEKYDKVKIFGKTFINYLRDIIKTIKGITAKKIEKKIIIIFLI